MPFGSGGHFDENDKYKHHSFTESWFDLAGRRITLPARSSGQPTQGDVYIGTCLYDHRRRAKNTAASRHTIHVDVDGGTWIWTRSGEFGGFAIGSGSPGHGHVYVPVSENPTPAEFAILTRPPRNILARQDRSHRQRHSAPARHPELQVRGPRRRADSGGVADAPQRSPHRQA